MLSFDGIKDSWEFSVDPQPLELQEALVLSPKARLTALRHELHVGMKVLSEVTFWRPDKPATKVFGGKGPDFVRKLFSVAQKGVPWKAEYAEPIVLWLRQTQGWDAPLDLFSSPVTTREEFLSLARGNGPRPFASRVPITRRYADPEQDAASTLLDQIEVALAKDRGAYFARGKTRASLAEKDARALKEIVVTGGAFLPGPELTRLAAISPLCTGCGRGAEEYSVFSEVVEAHWQRRDEVVASLDSEEQYVGYAEMVARSVQARSLAGDLAAARERADVVEALWESGSLGQSRPRVVSVRTRVRESRAAGGVQLGDEQVFLGAAGAAFGNLSDEYLGSMMCRACRAVGARATDAQELIDEARGQMLRAISKYPDRGSGIRSRMRNLDFIQVCEFEARHSEDSERLDAVLRKPERGPRLQELVSHVKSPLRRAKLLFWTWRASGRNNEALLKSALGLLAQRPSVRRLCVLDVGPFKAELAKAFASMNHRS